jgi:[histone H3]-lysine36 N-dimethyltransferase SETMAR
MRVVDDDDTWVYDIDMQTNDSDWRMPTEPKPKKSRHSRSKVKVMLTVFFDYRDVLHSEFMSVGQTVKNEYYLSVIRRLKEQIGQKRPDLSEENSWILYHA